MANKQIKLSLRYNEKNIAPYSVVKKKGEATTDDTYWNFLLLAASNYGDVKAEGCYSCNACIC